MPKFVTRLLVLCSLLVFALSISSSIALAQAVFEPTDTPTWGPILPRGLISEAEDYYDTDCLMCHLYSELTGHLGDNDPTSLYVDPSVYYRSVHADAGLECLACHADQKAYPHQASSQVSCQGCHADLAKAKETEHRPISVELNYPDKRAMTLALNENCRPCHQENFEESVDSAHVRVLEGGNRFAPVCIDCHGSHDITPPDEPRAKISQTCAACHQAVYTTYQTSVHGAALEDESNPDVPTCVDCHGVHNVHGPRDPEFHNDMIATCGGCHADSDRMDKYGVSTEVFDTYLDDFHGRTVNFFRTTSNNAPSNKATCFDCHGVHNILPADNPSSTVYPENLQGTCQQCHDDATISFPDAWLSHYIPTWEKTPVLFGVNLAYSYLIPGVLGGFVIYIALDFRRRLSQRRRPSSQNFIKLDLDTEEDTEELSDE